MRESNRPTHFEFSPESKYTEVRRIDDVNYEELVAFFASGYGEAYIGDESLYRKIARSSGAVMLRGTEDDRIMGAALIAEKRVLSIATSRRAKLDDGSRYARAVHVLEKCISDGGAQWLTVGEEYERVHAVAEQAGMQRVYDPELIWWLLKEAHEAENYELHPDAFGDPLVVRTASHSRPNYEQQLWAYLPDIGV